MYKKNSIILRRSKEKGAFQGKEGGGGEERATTY